MIHFKSPVWFDMDAGEPGWYTSIARPDKPMLFLHGRAARPMEPDEALAFIGVAVGELDTLFRRYRKWQRALETYGMPRIHLALERLAGYREAGFGTPPPPRETMLNLIDETILALLEVEA